MVRNGLVQSIVVCVSIVFWTTEVAGVTAAEKCEADKLKTAGKYSFCRLKEEAKAVKTASMPDLSDCDAKYGFKWSLLELRAGAGVCPSEGDSTAIQSFITQHTDDLASALAGGPLPDCSGDLAACNADLTTCSGGLGTCTDSLGTCNGNLGTCDSSLSTCNGDLTTCNGGLATCTGSLGTCSGNLGTCTGSLTTCNGDLTACNGGLGTCTGSLGTCNGNLGTCNTSLTTCNGNLSTCSSDLTQTGNDLSTCNGNYLSCSGDLATCHAGTAAQGEVLTGKTFSSSNGLGLTGSMADNGAVSMTPGATSQPIAAGYHNGAGTVAGDSDLIASNIVDGIGIFGVTGTAPRAQPLRTGQTLCDQGDATMGVCPGSPVGQDPSVMNAPPRGYTDNGDGTITDDATRLMWEKLDNNNIGGIHDKDNTYTWYTAFTTKIVALNSSGFAGHTDWRVPTLNELQGLADYGRSLLAIDPVFNGNCSGTCTACSCTREINSSNGAGYWSSTTYRDIAYPNLPRAWYVNFLRGTLVDDGKGAHYGVRAVRGGL